MDTPEYKALTQCYPTLVKCVEQDPSTIADKLVPSGILAPRDKQYIRNEHHEVSERARRLVDTVLTQTQLNQEVFNTFIKALEAAGPWTKAAVKELKLQLPQQESSDRGASVLAHQPPPNSSSSGTSLGPRQQGVLPCCSDTLAALF